MRNTNGKKMTIYVAMSGGVDSSVAASLLKDRGFNVVGVFMKPWQPAGLVCHWQQDRDDALRVAAILDIPFKTWDFSREYGERVARPLVEGYADGVTPNPDIECNREIKFGVFLDRAVAEGADAVATGHYARMVRSRSGLRISRAADTDKDQTYFLWRLKPSRLSRVLFPLGHLTKSRVRAIAREKGLPVASKKDSQGVCFVGPIHFRDFLKRRIRSRPGNIRDGTGAVIGSHDGAAYYTIGQRHGIGLADGKGPYYVVRKNVSINELTVGSERDLYCSRARLTHAQWFGERPREGSRVAVKVRYRTEPVRAVVGKRGVLHFSRPVRAVAPGQSAVLYRNGQVLGGGIIAL